MFSFKNNFLEITKRTKTGILIALISYNMNRKSILLLSGFLLFLVGFMSFILLIVGLQLSFLVWIDAAGPLVGFLARMFMIIVGIVMAYFGKTNWEDEIAENQQ